MLGRIVAATAGLCLLGQFAVSAAQAEPRVALVIGNSHYGDDIGTLPNPVNDAGLIAKALQQTGFQVIKVTDANQKQMKRAIADFGDKLAAAGPTATGLFFYAGHGLQVQGMNYLIPTDADISKEADVSIESVSADAVTQQMEFAGSRVNIVVLDACRNNPLARSFRSVSRGLAPISAAQGTFVAYSTAPGSVAADGAGSNSPYTKALASIIVQPGVGIEEAFREVRTEVMAATGDKQVPWDSSSLTAPFFFKAASAQAPAQQPTSQPASQATAQPAPSQPGKELDLAFWRIIENSRQAADYQAYLEQFPNGTFATLARNRVASLGQGVTRAESAPAAQPTATPKAAPAAAPTAPAPVATETSTTESPAKPAPPPGVKLDSNGVDCRIMDANRSASECVGVKKSKPANKPKG